MEIKEAIEWLENYVKCVTFPKTTNKVNKIIDNIIVLLQRGEAYEQMWNKFKRYRGGVWSNIGNDYVKELMVIYEQKYLKEVKQDYPEGDE